MLSHSLLKFKLNIWNLLWRNFFFHFPLFRCWMQFGKLVVALTFHQVDTSCAGGGRPRQWLLHKATRARNLIQVLNTNGLVGIFGQIFFAIWTNPKLGTSPKSTMAEKGLVGIFGQICFAIWTNVYSHLDKSALGTSSKSYTLWQTGFSRNLRTNMFWYLDKSALRTSS